MDHKKVGILGGTFDPIHNGHLILAQTAGEQFGLDEIWIMPAKTPPHKSDHKITAAEHRVAMTRLAIEDNPRFTLSLFEMKRSGYTYTCETLRLLTENNPEAAFYFIMGADSVFDFDKWRHPEQIAALSVILVANRSEDPDRKLLEQIERIRENYHGDVRLLKIPALEIASHTLREMAASGASIRYYTPDAVVQYIEDHQLYR